MTVSKNYLLFNSKIIKINSYILISHTQCPIQHQLCRKMKKKKI
uniref:Uncharacterized protein n=1 Tax=Manihot esculenta TaxID=3983 RepID=A0A2C9WLQ5_MANES